MFKVGQYQLYSILTSRFALDGGAMFGIIPKPLWEKKVTVDNLNRIEMVTRSLLIVGEERKILIDTGNGEMPSKLKEIYKIDRDSVNLQSSLGNVGWKVEDITDVIITHLHFDHSGGNTKMVNGQCVPVFPNARYYVQKLNYEHANSPNERDRGSYMEENWRGLKDRGVLELLQGEQELFPGISLRISNGHTFGQQVVIISDGQSTVLYCGDVIPTSAHIPIAWIMGYDLQPLVMIEEKKRILQQAVAEKWVLFYDHDYKYVATKVLCNEKGFVPGEEVVI